MKEGEIYEFNNKTSHGVQNHGDTDRIHIILDYSKTKINKPFQYIEKDKVVEL